MTASSCRTILVDFGETLIYPDPPVERQYLKVASGLFPGGDLPSPRIVLSRFHRAFDQLYSATRGACFGTTETEGFWFWQRVVGAVFPCFDGDDIVSLTSGVYQNFLRAAAWSLFPGVRKALGWFEKQNFQLVLLSNWDLRARRLLHNLELFDCFDQLFISSEVGFHKPDPRLFKYALERLNMAPEKLCMLGNDIELDLRPAADLGMQTIWFKGSDALGDWTPAATSWVEVTGLFAQNPRLQSNSCPPR